MRKQIRSSDSQGFTVSMSFNNLLLSNKQETQWLKIFLKISILFSFMILWHDWVQLESPFGVRGLECSRWPTDIFGVFAGMAARWGLPHRASSTPRGLSLQLMSPQGSLRQGNQIFYSRLPKAHQQKLSDFLKAQAQNFSSFNFTIFYWLK